MWAIAQFSLLKMRESAFYMLMILAAVICVCTNTADPVSEQIARGSLFSYAFNSSSSATAFSMGSCIALIISILISSFYGATEIPSDINTGVIQVILSKPVGRFRYLAGKYLAIVIMAFSIFLFLELVLFLSYKLFGFGNVPYNSLKALWSQLIPSLFLLPLIAANFAFSILAGALGAMIFTTLYLLFSIAAAFIPLTIAIFPDGMVPFMEEIFFLFHYLFLNPLFYFHESASGGFVFAALVGYTVSVSALFLLFTIYVLYTADLNEAH